MSIPSITHSDSGERKPTKYADVAARLAAMIERGTYTPGARVPSVRQLSKMLAVSVSTVSGAYRVLEDAGLIESRPQSGYYVPAGLAESAIADLQLGQSSARTARPKLTPAEPAISSPNSRPTPVTTSDVAAQLICQHGNMSMLPLGAAIMNPALMPYEKLDRTMARVMRKAGPRAHLYDPPPGCEELRIQLARRMVKVGCTLNPEQIVTTSGCQEALVLCLLAVCKPGDTIAIESPTYFGILQAIETLGLHALEIPTSPRDGISLDALEYWLERDKSIKACLLVPNYSNPLGSLMPDDNKRDLVALLAKHEVPLIEDDIYGDLGYTQERPRVAKAWDSEGGVMLCSSFSKTLSAGYRVGWIAPGRWQPEVERQKRLLNIGSALPPQLAVAEFLAGGGYDYHLRRIRRVLAQQAERVTEAIAYHFPEGTKVTRPSGGFVLWVELPAYADSIRLFNDAAQHAISVAPGPIFSASGHYTNFVRLNTAFWSGEVERGLDVLGRLIRGQR